MHSKLSSIVASRQAFEIFKEFGKPVPGGGDQSPKPLFGSNCRRRDRESMHLAVDAMQYRANQKLVCHRDNRRRASFKVQFRESPITPDPGAL